MSRFINKLFNATEAFLNEMNRPESDIFYKDEFTLGDAREYFLASVEKNERIDRCMISIQIPSDVKEVVSSKERWIIKLILLDKYNNPLEFAEGEYIGKLVKANQIDEELERFMGGKMNKTFRVNKESKL